MTQLSQPESTEAPFFRVARIVVKGNRLVCSIQLSPRCPRVSSASFMRVLLTLHPQLPFHACKNEQGTNFGCVMNETALIHVFEHVAIDCMVQEETQKNACSNTLFRGNSQWDNYQQGRGRVELSFHDDLAALRAIKQATAQINQALVQTISR